MNSFRKRKTKVAFKKKCGNRVNASCLGFKYLMFLPLHRHRDMDMCLMLFVQSGANHGCKNTRSSENQINFVEIWIFQVTDDDQRGRWRQRPEEDQCKHAARSLCFRICWNTTTSISVYCLVIHGLRTWLSMCRVVLSGGRLNSRNPNQ